MEIIIERTEYLEKLKSLQKNLLTLDMVLEADITKINVVDWLLKEEYN